MVRNDVVRSSCGLCSAGCGVLVELENGNVTKVTGDPYSPINKGELCVKGQASLEYLYHPDRLQHPLKRVGGKAEGKWKQISWDEALDTIANELIRLKDNHGSESVAIIQGHNKGLQDSYLTRFANVYGTPNIAASAHVCHLPRSLASQITCGFFPYPDFEYPPACIMVWGANALERNIGEYGQTIQALNRGIKLILIDPRKIDIGSRAELWLQLRPGSDLALALGMIHVIVNEGLCDNAFIDKWTIGFDKLKVHVQEYPPEKVEKITWVDAETISKAARLYATTKPASVQWGNAIDQNVNSFQTARAISILRAITGNLGVPGGDAQWSPLPLVARRSPELSLEDKMPTDKWDKRVGAELKLLPNFRYVLPQSVVKAILEEDPYLIRAALIDGANPLLTYTNAQKTYQALKKLNFLVVADTFMTPTAELADIVLPAASYLEFDSIVIPSYYPIAQVQQKVAERGECWSDYRILGRLAKKLGLGEYFWDDEEQFLDAILKPAGLTFEEFRKVGVISGTKLYRKYEVAGFETPSHKVEIYSSQLKEWGLDPLPIYHELPETPYSNPELVKEYPLVLTSWKSVAFRHSEGRQIATLRDSHPEPIICINPETAKMLAVKEGDWVYVETKRGRMKQKTVLTNNIDPKVVGVDYAWWFPEKGMSRLYGWSESNINILTDDRPPYNCELGSGNLRGILCRVYKCKDQ